MVTIIKEKKRRGLSMIVNQFSGKSRNADAASLNFVKETVTATQGFKFQNTELKIKTRNPHLETPTLTTRLNTMIAAGVKFDISADGFQLFGASEREIIFLHDHQTAILCTLHQALLMKYLPLDYIVRFTDEINERTAILSDGATIVPPFEIVAEVSREWFIDMSEELLKR